MQKPFATFVSRVFEPAITLSLLILLGIFISGMSGYFLARLLVVTFFGMIVPPVALRYWAHKKWNLLWDIPNRKQRIVPLMVLLVSIVLDLVLVWFFGNAFLVKLAFTIFVYVLGFFLVTLFWKISGHTSANALVTGILISWFGWGWWPILLIVPLVGWARVVRKDHTVLQVVIGSVYSWTLVWVASWIS